MKIYIIEDSQDRLTWFRKTFYDCEIYYTDKIEQACEDIRTNEYDIIFIDRDLGGESNAEEITSYMSSLELAIKSTIIIHTMNVPAQKRMVETLGSYHPNIHLIPFIQLMKMNREDFGLNN